MGKKRQKSLDLYVSNFYKIFLILQQESQEMMDTTDQETLQASTSLPNLLLTTSTAFSDAMDATHTTSSHTPQRELETTDSTTDHNSDTRENASPYATTNALASSTVPPQMTISANMTPMETNTTMSTISPTSNHDMDTSQCINFNDTTDNSIMDDDNNDNDYSSLLFLQHTRLDFEYDGLGDIQPPCAKPLHMFTRQDLQFVRCASSFLYIAFRNPLFYEVTFFKVRYVHIVSIRSP